MLIPTNKITSVLSVGKLASSTPSKYTSSRGIIMNGTSINAPRMEVNIKSPIDCAKYFSSLSRICTNAEFGAVITRKITFRSKYKVSASM